MVNSARGEYVRGYMSGGKNVRIPLQAYTLYSFTVSFFIFNFTLNDLENIQQHSML